MTQNYTAHASTTVNAPLARVWLALIDPPTIKKYFLGSDIVTTWQEGSPILYKGTYNGKAFEDKGTIIQVKPEQRLVVTHYSPLSGVPDIPENYHTVTYDVAPVNGGTRVSITQDKNGSEKENDDSTKIWTTVLDNMKKLLESTKWTKTNPRQKLGGGFLC